MKSVREWLTANGTDALLRRALLLCGGSEADAEDIVQEATVRALKGERAGVAVANPEAYLHRALSFAFVDWCRRKKARRTAGDQVALESDPERQVEPAEWTDAPDWSSITPAQMAAAVARLPEHYRRVIVMKEYEGKSYEVIARTLDIPKTTIGTQLYRARQLLRDLLSTGMGEGGGQ